MSLPNPGMSFTPFDPLPASDLNDLVENIEALAAGTGLNDLAIATAKLADAAVTTRKLKPGRINIKATSSSNFSITSATYTDVTGISGSYTSGPTAERLFLEASFLAQQNSGASSNICIVVNGVLGEDETYIDSVPVHWAKQVVSGWFDVPANTTVTIKLQARGSGVGTISFGSGGASPTWKPSIRGFAISQ